MVCWSYISSALHYHANQLTTKWFSCEYRVVGNAYTWLMRSSSLVPRPSCAMPIDCCTSLVPLAEGLGTRLAQQSIGIAQEHEEYQRHKSLRTSRTPNQPVSWENGDPNPCLRLWDLCHGSPFSHANWGPSSTNGDPLCSTHFNMSS